MGFGASGFGYWMYDLGLRVVLRLLNSLGCDKGHSKPERPAAQSLNPPATF